MLFTPSTHRLQVRYLLACRIVKFRNAKFHFLNQTILHEDILCKYYLGFKYFYIMQVRTLSQKQLELLKAPLSVDFFHNARPLQPLNGRKIEMYHYHPNQKQGTKTPWTKYHYKIFWLWICLWEFTILLSELFYDSDKAFCFWS